MTSRKRKIDELITTRVLSVFPKTERIVLFGSRAYDNPHPDSDYDLLVVADSDLPQVERGVNVRLALRAIPAAFDILVMTPKEFKRLSKVRSGVVSIAAREGLSIYETPAE